MPTTKQTSKGRAKGGNRTTTRRSKRPAPRSSPSAALVEKQVDELVLQALETELGGVQVYEAAIRAAVDPGLRQEWKGYLDETRHHVTIVERLCVARGLDTDKETPGRRVVRSIGEALVEAIGQASDAGNPEAAELVAAECVTLAETKDHQNWKLLTEVAKELEGDERATFEQACDEVEDQEDEHLYHTMGWTRELWLQSLGLPAVLPPPEERAKVKSMLGAATAQKGRKALARRR